MKKYCLNDAIKINSSNVFDYITPTCIFIERNNNTREVGILCEYTGDKEHGIAIVFKDEKFDKIVPQGDFI